MALGRLFCRLSSATERRVAIVEDHFEGGMPNVDIIKAATKNNKALVRAAIRQDSTKVFMTNSNGSTALTIAAFHSNSSIVRLLLENGADPDHINNAGVSCLMFATKCGQFDSFFNRLFHSSYDSLACCELLLAYGANLETRTLLGTTAIMMAQAANNVDVIKLFIKRGADVTPYRINGQNLLDLGTAKTKERLRKAMNRYQFDTVLHQAVYMDDLNTVRTLVSAHDCQSRFVNTPGNRGWTPLHTAVLLNRVECVRVLLHSGADPRIRENIHSISPLHIAASRGYLDVLNELIIWSIMIASSGPTVYHYDEAKDHHRHTDRLPEENFYLDANSEMVLYSTSP